MNDKDNVLKKQEFVRKNIVEQYVKYRKEKNLTQEELANNMGIKRPNISRFESGQCNPTLDMLVRMADCMELDIEIILINKKEAGVQNDEE